ncbi:MAG TPA: type 4a pilus biogenesis protein PilO [Nitrospiria bacterium]|nr:type 4a pilus biogenesis protein PilO [Nitrospiria bacterium]
MTRMRLRRLAVPIALATMAAVTDVGMYAAVVYPSRQTVERNDAAWKAERERLARYKNYQQAYTQVTSLTARATARDDLPTVVTMLASLAKKRGLKIPEVKYQPERLDLKDFQKVGLTFSIAGPYADIRRFLNDLERSSPFLAIDGLTLTRGREKESAEIEVQVKVAAYLRTA